MKTVKLLLCAFALALLLALSAGAGVLIGLERMRAEVERLDLEVRNLGAVQAALVETLTRGWRQNATRLDAVERQTARLEATVVDTIQTSIEKLFPAALEAAIRG